MAAPKGWYQLSISSLNKLVAVSASMHSFSDVILIHIRTAVSSFFHSLPHSSSHQHKTLFTLCFSFSSLTFLSFLILPSHNLCVLSLLATIFILSFSFVCAVPGILPLSLTRSQLSKIIFQRWVFKTVSLYGNLPFVKKGEGNRVKFKGCAICQIQRSHLALFLVSFSHHLLRDLVLFIWCFFSYRVLPAGTPILYQKDEHWTFLYLLPLTPSHFLFLLLPLLNSSFIWYSSPSPICATAYLQLLSFPPSPFFFYFNFFPLFLSPQPPHLVLNEFVNLDGNWAPSWLLGPDVSGIPKPGQPQSIFYFSDYLRDRCSVRYFIILISSVAIHGVYSVNGFNIRAVLFPPSRRSNVMLFPFPAYSRAWRIRHEYLSANETLLSHSFWMWNVLPIHAFSWKELYNLQSY